MPYSAAKIANEMLAIARERGEELSPLKLLKLVYIAHGWAFPLLEEQLLDEQPQAWQYGPVVPSLYRAISGYRAGPVTRPIPDHDPQQLSADEHALIRSVYDTYSRYSAVQLSNLTHLPGSPWYEAWNERGRNAVIGNDRISEHYRQLWRERGAAAA
ncbi:Panacea domain-containing protein [Sphingomonas sp. BK580]|uniref:Panacea domain-containing protein n=1 Tax=Sphingomonas sp. BK580 TaxID=2586972 RepID=UPI00161E0519|nr:type II toxin-antitoxin system antitoxin SocA domain-containing protein [Sphingomonas sp. BK580]MBB3692495.1 putative phage-associated protein [Sphingomonas sp. BK580]